MRRKDREVTDFKRVLQIMDNCDCCRIGLVDRHEAYIVPLNFGYEQIDDSIILYFHCANVGKKIDLIPEQSVVAFEMDTKHTFILGETGCDCTYLYQCIMGKGIMEIVNDYNDKIYGLTKIMQHYSDSDSWDFDIEIVNQVLVLKLTVTEWSCKEH